MGTKGEDDSVSKVRIRSNGTATDWGTATDGDQCPSNDRPVPIVRLNKEVLRTATPGTKVRLAIREARINVLVGEAVLGEVSGQHERKIRRHRAESGTLIVVNHEPPSASFIPSR